MLRQAQRGAVARHFLRVATGCQTLYSDVADCASGLLWFCVAVAFWSSHLHFEFLLQFPAGAGAAEAEAGWMTASGGREGSCQLAQARARREQADALPGGFLIT